MDETHSSGNPGFLRQEGIVHVAILTQICSSAHSYEYVLGFGYSKFKRMFSISVTLGGNNLYLFEFVFPLQAELSGFDDWPPIQQCVSKSDNE